LTKLLSKLTYAAADRPLLLDQPGMARDRDAMRDSQVKFLVIRIANGYLISEGLSEHDSADRDSPELVVLRV